MAEHSSIEWTDATWNPITGCSVCSAGCANCYAMILAGSRLKNIPSRKGLTKQTKAGPVWTGDVRFNEKALMEPLKWKRPRMIFVCAHGDLFHESVPDEWIDRVFAVMAMCPQHTFQVLTKRSARMHAYMNSIEPLYPDMLGSPGRVNALMKELSGGSPMRKSTGWPLRNVWLGVSAERQQEADARIPDLLATPAAVRFVSLEPLLGHIDLTHICLVPQVKGSHRAGIHLNVLSGHYYESGMPYVGDWDIDDPAGRRNVPLIHLDWVIVGGESQPSARPMHPDWARSLRDQCAEADIPFLFKQWGNWAQCSDVLSRKKTRWAIEGGHIYTDNPIGLTGKVRLGNVGKKRAGRLLDGVEHNGMPGDFAKRKPSLEVV